MSRVILPVILAISLTASTAALAQSTDGTGSGMNSNFGSMSGGNIDVDHGINANGTPKQQSPGVSMTNGPQPDSATLNGDGAASPGGAASTLPTGSTSATMTPGGTGMGGSSGGSAASTSGGGTGK